MANKCPTCHSDNPETVKFCGECGTKLDASPPGHPPGPEDRASLTRTLETSTDELTRGTTVAGRYEIIEELGTGGMGRVYRAHDTKLNEEVALKLIKPEIAAERRVVERFRNELKTARKITHKNVCRMYDFHEEGKTLYLTMEYVRGEDLKSLIHRMKALTVGAAVSVARQVAEGLGEAHELGIVHRDLKPGNIMIDKEGNAKIMDFGIARTLAGVGTTAEGAVIGTPEYMSPEQVEGKPADQRADIYALGVILFEMVTGRAPFEGDTSLAIAHKHRYEPAPDPRTLNPQIPVGLIRVILRCLEKEREARYQTTSELLAGLEAIETSIPATELAPTGRPSTKRKPTISKKITVEFTARKLLIPASVLIAILAIGVVIWKALPRKEAHLPLAAKHSVAVLPFVDLSPDKKNEHLADGISDALINALSRIRDLRVPGRTSAFSFKGQAQDLRDIGKKLNVKTVLEGSVQVMGEKLRISAQLINAEDGFQLWSEKYDRDMDDIFAVQDEISLEIVDKLKMKLLQGEKTKVLKRHTENKDAYNLYLKGRYFWNRRNEGDLKRAIECYHEAIEKDPNYSLPYLGIADYFIMMGLWSYLPPETARLKSKEALDKALEIDNQLSEAYTSLGYFQCLYDWDWAVAERNLKRGIALNPNNVWAHAWYGCFLMGMGLFDEAGTEIKIALEMEPLSPIINAIAGIIISMVHVEEGKKQVQRAIEMEPNLALAHLWLGQIYMSPKVVDEKALEHLQSAVNLDLTFALGWLGCAYARLGKKEEAIKILGQLDELSKERYISPLQWAAVYSGLEMYDQAFEYLEKAYSQKEPFLALSVYSVKTLSSGFPQEFRLDERFKALARKMKKTDIE